MSFRHITGCAAIVLAVTLAGCSSQGDDTHGKLVVENRLAPPAAQILRKSNFAEPDSLDPARSNYNYSAFILLDMYEGLTNLDGEGRAVPGVAKSWDVSTDGKTYTFHLRHDARWSNGEPVTAADFVFALRRAVDPATAAPLGDLLAPISNARAILDGKMSADQLGVEATDAHTLVMHLRAPTLYLPTLVANPIAFPVYPPAVKRWSNRFTQPEHSVSNGAYRISEWVVNDHVTLVRNRQYWNDPKTHINKVIYYPINAEEAFTRFRAGDVDFTDRVPTRQIGWIRKHLGDMLMQQPYSGAYKYSFNLQRAPFKGALDLRRALTMVVDRRVITDKLLRGGQQPAYSVVPPMPGHPAYLPDWAKWSMTRRVKEARRLYAAAGYSPAKPLHVTMSFPTTPNNQRVAAAIAAMWHEALGVRTQLINKEAKVFIDDARLREVTEVPFDGWVADYLDPYDFLQVYMTGNPNNLAGYFNLAYDQLLEASQDQTDAKTRERMMLQAEKLLDSFQPSIPIYYYTRTRLIQPYVKGVQPNPMDYHYTRELSILAHHRE